MARTKKTKTGANQQPTLPGEGMARPQFDDLNEAVEAFDKTASTLSELRGRAQEQRIIVEERMRAHNLREYLDEEAGLRVTMTTKEKAKIDRPDEEDES